MDQSKIDMFMSTEGKKFPVEKADDMRKQLEGIDDSKFAAVQGATYRDPMMMLIISIFLGAFGVDRFMLGQTGPGVGKLLTCGGCGIWSIIDWFGIQKMTRETNYQKFSAAAK